MSLAVLADRGLSVGVFLVVGCGADIMMLGVARGDVGSGNGGDEWDGGRPDMLEGEVDGCWESKVYDGFRVIGSPAAGVAI